jgi:hypothetical protein
MFFNLIIDTSNTNFDNFMNKNILTSSPESELLALSKIIYCNKEQTIFIFYTEADFSQELTQQAVASLFTIGVGVVRNLNVLNTELTFNEIKDNLENIEYIEKIFEIYL